MDKVEELMDDFYNTLIRIRYPKITGASSKNIQSTILSDENRISLLSWLLIHTEHTPPVVATKLQNLKGPALETLLLKYYSELGICNDKQLLLGNCTIEKQLSFLKLLLNFIKCTFLESVENGEKKMGDITNGCKEISISDTKNTYTCKFIPRLSHDREAMCYLSDLQKYLDEHEKRSQDYESATNEAIDIPEDVKNENEETDWNLEAKKQRQFFMEACASDGSWPMPISQKFDSLPSFDKDIESIAEALFSVPKLFGGMGTMSPEEIRKQLEPSTMQDILSKIDVVTRDSYEQARKFHMKNGY